MKKQDKIVEMTENISQAKDGLGKSVDAGIKDLVISMNLMNIETHQSCEGHFHWGYPFPWVTFVDGTMNHICEELMKRCDVMLVPTYPGHKQLISKNTFRRVKEVLDLDLTPENYAKHTPINIPWRFPEKEEEVKAMILELRKDMDKFGELLMNYFLNNNELI